MPLEFRNTSREDLDRVTGFLRSIFRVGPEHRAFHQEHMLWKYYEPRPDWPGSRSYVLEEGGRIVAHVATMPGTVLLESGPLRCTHFIDWGAEEGNLVAGSALLRKITRMFDLTFCIGGSPDNRRLLPKFGFQTGHPTSLYARPIRPWRQILTHQSKNWKSPLRLGRNISYAAVPQSAESGWTAVAADPDLAPSSLWNPPGAGAAPRLRTPELYRYFLNSKEPRFEFYLLLRHGTPCGCFCLALVPGQARVVDIWIMEPSEENLASAFFAIQRLCKQKPDVCELVFRASTPMQEAAARRAGLRFVSSDALMRFPASRGTEEWIESPLIVDDAAYLHAPTPWYLT